MKIIYSITLLLLSLTSIAQVYSGPESVEFDSVNNRWLISNTSSHQVLARDSTGVLSVFVTGIGSGPYGIEIAGNTLFCCSGTSIKGYDLTTGISVFNLNVGASFLNGLTHDNSGNLITTDFTAKTIHKISIANQTDTIIATGLPQSPNGIIFDDANNRCVFVNWGSNAPIKAINLSTFAVTTIIATTLSNCDGVARDGQGRYYVSNWGNQSVVRYDSDFVAPPTTVGTGLSSPADIFYDVTHDILAIPNSGNNTVTFLDFNTTSINEFLITNSNIAYPNPATSKISIEISDGKIDQLIIYNILGKVVHQEFAFDSKVDVDVSKFENGDYKYLLKNNFGKIENGSFVILR